MARSRFIVGIDLGTTNCALAYVDTKGRERPAADIRTFEVPQLVGPGETGRRSMLPSFLYMPAGPELPPGAAALPWDTGAQRIVGEFARTQGARVPGRLVSSAKSWLCHPGVDREAGILPWGAGGDVPRVSPVEASASYLMHLRDAWNSAVSQGQPELRLENQEIVLTVPASFDEAARELTVAAAKRAGFDRLTLLEEPQAAFYCWIVSNQDGWQQQLRAGELILVCDVGGGTTDFSLITVVETPTGPGFRRVAVGDHLLLGGDNIDLALAHRVEQKLGGPKLDTEQWSALRFACRNAKERLLADEAPPERMPVTIAGRGSRVIGGSLQSELTRAEAVELAVEGYFPRVSRTDAPRSGGRAGLQEFGLPFVADPAVTRHLSAFLKRHRAEAIAPEGHAPDDRPARPDAILFNGGALTPSVLRERIVDVVASWFPDEPDGWVGPRVLSNASLDLAVAQGAAYYGVVRRGGGIRIGGGTARSFYVGFDSEDRTRPWLCVVPRDAQEGDEIGIEGHDFELLVDQPVAFPLASSSVRPQDKAGDLVESNPDAILTLPPLVGHMKVGRKAKTERVPVRMVTRVTEVGTIELWCQSRNDERRWRLSIQFRTAGSSAAPAAPSGDEGAVLEQSLVDAAVGAVEEAFALGSGAERLTPARLIKRLEEVLEGPKDGWPLSALRALWNPLRDGVAARARSPQHESRWLNLAGYCLRPGTGFPLDEGRLKALWPVFHAGVLHPKEVQCWVEWWVMWRRVAAGLKRAHHEEIHRRLVPFLIPSKTVGTTPAKKAGRLKPEPHEVAEMWRCVAALERIEAEAKEALGEVLAKDLGKASRPAHVLWCLGRLGGRVPLYGPANTVVGPEVARRWAEGILGLELGALGARERADGVFALVSLGRMSGDRARDLDAELRERIAGRLAELGEPDSVVRPLSEVEELRGAEQGEALGDALPVGLRLLRADGD